MKSIHIALILTALFVISIVTIALAIQKHPAIAHLNVDSHTVVCGAGFFFKPQDMQPGDMKRLEQLSQATCKPKHFEKRTQTLTPVKNRNKAYRQAILLKGEVCVINWELIPSEAEKAYQLVCLEVNNG